MPQIHFIDGEKGGVGKSLFCRTLAHHCIDRKLDFYLIESDRTNPDIKKFYKDKTLEVLLSEKETKSVEADKIYDLCTEMPVLVSLPANIYTIVKDWITSNGLTDPAMNLNVEVYKWFVCNGGHDSINLFVESARAFEGKVKHIFVKNMGLCEDWGHLSGYPELEKVIKDQGIKQIEFPKLVYLERNLLDRDTINFSDAVDDAKELLPPLARRRVRGYLQKFAEAIDTPGLMSAQAFEGHVNKKDKKKKAAA